ncbi:MAG: dTDP-4-dehydrorhamnose reductase [Oscillospiraceae bacterium]|nr:dTDP-4-dehydrorhamnose reductase [Oscillospiraceae bacterium]
MKILLTGAKGMLASDVAKRLDCLGIDFLGIDIDELDITDEAAVLDFVKAYKPDSVIHCAAYTAVDKAEDESELCMRVNSDGTANIAKACKSVGAQMLYISTDYVFDGTGETPFETNTPKSPLNVYGKSKSDGEDAVTEFLDKYYIVRISWVFGSHGNNFVKTMLRLCETKSELSIVGDQFGSPTYTVDLAVLLCEIVMSGKYGVYHATNEGFCSWAEFAEEIMRISESPCTVKTITTESYPTKAVRPRNSRLSKSSLDENGFKRLPDWREALKRYLSV